MCESWERTREFRPLFNQQLGSRSLNTHTRERERETVFLLFVTMKTSSKSGLDYVRLWKCVTAWFVSKCRHEKTPPTFLSCVFVFSSVHFKTLQFSCLEKWQHGFWYNNECRIYRRSRSTRSTFCQSSFPYFLLFAPSRRSEKRTHPKAVSDPGRSVVLFVLNKNSLGS